MAQTQRFWFEFRSGFWWSHSNTRYALISMFGVVDLLDSETLKSWDFSDRFSSRVALHSAKYKLTPFRSLFAKTFFPLYHHVLPFEQKSWKYVVSTWHNTRGFKEMKYLSTCDLHVILPLSSPPLCSSTARHTAAIMLHVWANCAAKGIISVHCRRPLNQSMMCDFAFLTLSHPPPLFSTHIQSGPRGEKPHVHVPSPSALRGAGPPRGPTHRLPCQHNACGPQGGYLF